MPALLEGGSSKVSERRVSGISGGEGEGGEREEGPDRSVYNQRGREGG